MFTSQLSLDLFTQRYEPLPHPLLVVERNKGKENNDDFQKRKPKFHNQTIEVLKLLVAGMVVDSVSARELNIVDVRPRFAKLKSMGARMKINKLKNGLKQRYCTEAQIIYNKEKFKEYLD